MLGALWNFLGITFAIPSGKNACAQCCSGARNHTSPEKSSNTYKWTIARATPTQQNHDFGR